MNGSNSNILDEEMWSLGALISNPTVRDEGFLALNRNYFEAFENQIVFDLINEFYGKNQDFDWGVVAKELEKRGRLTEVGGSIYIQQLIESCPISKNIKTYAERLREKSIERNIYNFKDNRLPEILAGEGTITEKLYKAVSELENASDNSMENTLIKADRGIPDAWKDIKLTSERDFSMNGVPTGFKNLDKYVKCFRPGDMVVIAARPSMGKTSYACNTLANLVTNQLLNKDRKKVAALFSLEMDYIQLYQRMISAQAGVSFEKMISGNLPEPYWMRVAKSVNQFYPTNLFIDDKTRDINKIESKARRLRNSIGLDLLVMDYFQLMSMSTLHPKMPRNERMTEISQKVQQMAKELEVPIILLSQLNRDVDKRNDKMPMFSDLRDTGGLEQDATIIIFMMRPWVYNKKDPKEDRLKTMIEVAKNKNGNTGITELNFLFDMMRFEDRTGNLNNN